jgi:hypothetical protein
MVEVCSGLSMKNGVRILRYSQQIPEDELEAILIDVLTTKKLALVLGRAR